MAKPKAETVNIDDELFDDGDFEEFPSDTPELSPEEPVVPDNKEIAVSIQAMLQSSEISPEEHVFIEAFATSLNKQGSMEIAFPGLSVHQKKYYADKLLEKPAINAVVSASLQKNLDASVQRSPALLMTYVLRYLDLNVRDYYYDNGEPKPLNKIDPDALLLLEGVQRSINNKTGAETIVYNIPSKLKVLDKLEGIVKLLITVKNVAGPMHDPGEDDAEVKRREIFNRVNKYKEQEQSEPEPPRRKRKKIKDTGDDTQVVSATIMDDE